MTKILHIAVLLFALTNPLVSRTQTLPSGQYIGYERIDVRKATEGISFYPGMYVRDSNNVIDRSWFHQVAISIYNDSVSISKTPIFIKNDQIFYSDSIGSFYYYKGMVTRLKDSSVAIRVYLDSTRYAAYHGSGTPYYVRSGYSHVKVEGGNLVLEAGYLGRLVFRRLPK